MKVHTDIEQRTEGWNKIRLGRITSTKFKELCAGRPATVELLYKKVAAEILTGVSCEKPFNLSPAMEEGIRLEGEARAAYELETKSHVKEVGFISKEKLWGCSPDGLVGDDGMVELKAPMSHTHLGYLMADGGAHKAYRWQIQGQLWVSGRDWVDFCSYCPSYSEDKRLLIERVTSAHPDQIEIHNAAVKLEARVAEILEAVK